jgi:hypothetical protein
MIGELGTELETLCLKFAMDIDWTEGAAPQGRQTGRKRQKTAQEVFDTSSDEDEAGPSEDCGGLQAFGGQLADSTRRVIKTHVLEYLRERLRPVAHGERRVKDPLAYWAQNQGRWPIVAQVARHSLCVPAASATSERGFSKTGHIVRARRASLSDERVAQLSFLSSNPDA